jgi:hypothetical protein
VPRDSPERKPTIVITVLNLLAGRENLLFEG